MTSIPLPAEEFAQAFAQLKQLLGITTNQEEGDQQ